MLHNHSLIRIEQWFNSSQSFTLYADSVYIEYSGEVFRPEMMNIEGATVDSIIIEGMTPIAFALKFKKSCDKLFGDSLILYEKIHNGLSTDTVKAGFFIDRHEWNREQVQSLQKNPKYRAIGEFYAKKEKELIKRLSSNVQDLFNNMYSGHRDVYVDEKYNLVMTYNGRSVDDTGGLRVIQYFAYVGGLVKLARELMSEKEDDARLGESYPLVLDAAFSHADDKHITSISKELAKSTNQLIFALMGKDWVYAESGLSGKVARTYELKKIDETEVHIVEVV